jgi:hypothetical protein
MKTADFRDELTPNGQISVPPEIASRVPPGEQIQIVLQWGHLRRRRCLAHGWPAAIRGSIRCR